MSLSSHCQIQYIGTYPYATSKSRVGTNCTPPSRFSGSSTTSSTCNLLLGGPLKWWRELNTQFRPHRNIHPPITTTTQFIVSVVTGPTVGKKKKQAVPLSQRKLITAIGRDHDPRDFGVTGKSAGLYHALRISGIEYDTWKPIVHKPTME